MPTDSLDGQADVQRLMEVTFAFGQSQALFAAVELGVFAVLEKGELDAAAICERLGLSPRGMTDLLDALVGLGFLARTDARYSLTPIAARHLLPDSPSAMADLIAFVASRLYPVWSRLAEGLRSGLPQNEAKQELDYYANLGADSDRHARFLKGMAGLSARPAEVIAKIFPWSRYKTFVDLGGASGDLARRLLDAHRHLRGMVFDLPPVQPFFDAHTEAYRDRLSFCAGDFFTSRLPAADVYVAGHVLHNWDMDQKRTILSRVAAAVAPGGAVMIYEWLLDDERQQWLPLLDSMQMRLVTRDGGGITARTCRDLLHEAGLTRADTLASDYPYTVVVGWKD